MKRRIQEELLAHAHGVKREELLFSEFQPNELYQSYLERAERGEPLAQILGYVDFYGCMIEVNRDVLIPRPETELLVDLVAKEINAPAKLWDLCSGSGCIGIALKKRFPELDVTLIDISPEAIEVSYRNAQKNNVEVRHLLGDLLEPVKGEKADFIVSNPPYISKEDYEGLDPSVKDYEPRRALLGGESGIEIYEKLARELPVHLEPGGKVFFEIGETQGQKISTLFTGKKQQIKCDYTGRERFFFLEME